MGRLIFILFFFVSCTVSTPKILFHSELAKVTVVGDMVEFRLKNDSKEGFTEYHISRDIVEKKSIDLSFVGDIIDVILKFFFLDGIL
jgi:hypothetical protein